MKNIFKFLGMALIASSLTFVACSDDDDETKTVMNVTYGETSWDAVDFMVVNAGSMMTATLYGDKDEDFPACTFTCGTAVQTYDLAETNAFVSYDADGNGEDVCLQKGKIELKGFDATNHTMDANIETETQSGKALTVTIENATWELATLED